MSSYRDLVRVTGPAFLILSFLARLPAAMVPLGVITLVASVTGSFAAAGAVAAGYGLGAALGGPVVGGLADRFGQRIVGLVAALINAAALTALVLAVHSGIGSALGALVAAAAGFSTPQVGPLVRVRWASLLAAPEHRRTMSTAFSFEGAADELSYMAGPALVGVIALLGSAEAPLFVAAVLTVLAAVPFALHKTAPAVVRGGRTGLAKDRLPVGALAALTVAMLAMGAIFGATQTGVTAFAGSIGADSAAGLIYAVLGVGSALAGIATAWIPARVGLVTRYVAGSVALAAGGLLLIAMPGSLGGVLVAMAAIGIVSAPYLISVYGLANAITPAHRAGTVMTLLASGVVAGVALGAGVAGRLADAFGYAGAFAIPLVAGVLAVAVALISRPAIMTFVVRTRPNRLQTS